MFVLMHFIIKSNLTEFVSVANKMRASYQHIGARRTHSKKIDNLCGYFTGLSLTKFLIEPFN